MVEGGTDWQQHSKCNNKQEQTSLYPLSTSQPVHLHSQVGYYFLHFISLSAIKKHSYRCTHIRHFNSTDISPSNSIYPLNYMTDTKAARSNAFYHHMKSQTLNK